MSNNNLVRSGGSSTVYKKITDNLKVAARSLFRNATAWIFSSDQSGHGRYYYGLDDMLPNQIIEAINNSGTATACIEKLNEFTYGNGFLDTNLANMRLNSAQTWNEKLLDIVMNFNYLEGYALVVLYRNDGKFFSVEPVAVQMFRKDNGGFIYNELMGEIGRDWSKDIYMKEYVPGQALEIRSIRIKEQVDKYGYQVGEVYYPFKKRMGRLYSKYPVPGFYSDIESIIADAKVSQFDLRNISQGWRAAIVIATGPVNNETRDSEGKTEQDYYDEALSQFVGEEAAPVLHLKSRVEGEKPEITVLPLQDVVDAAAGASERVPKRVARTMQVPEVLIGMAQPGQLGNLQEIQNIMKLFALSMIKRQEFISATLDVLRVDLPEEYANVNFEISMLDVFGTQEGEQVGGVSARAGMTGKQNQNLERVLRKVRKGEHSIEQATFTLVKDFGYTEEDAKEYLTRATHGATNNQS